MIVLLRKEENLEKTDRVMFRFWTVLVFVPDIYMQIRLFLRTCLSLEAVDPFTELHFCFFLAPLTQRTAPCLAIALKFAAH